MATVLERFHAEVKQRLNMRGINVDHHSRAGGLNDLEFQVCDIDDPTRDQFRGIYKCIQVQILWRRLSCPANNSLLCQLSCALLGCSVAWSGRASHVGKKNTLWKPGTTGGRESNDGPAGSRTLIFAYRAVEL